MGCDIHLYLEHRPKDESKRGVDWWQGWPRINPGRDYGLFGKLAGVRYPDEEMFPARGLPDNLGFDAKGDSHLYISEHEGEDHATLERALAWEKRGCKIERNAEGKPTWVQHPDWHTHSWLSLAEFKTALSKKMEYEHDAEYWAILAAAEELEKRGQEVRFVFWFDN